MMIKHAYSNKQFFYFSWAIALIVAIALSIHVPLSNLYSILFAVFVSVVVFVSLYGGLYSLMLLIQKKIISHDDHELIVRTNIGVWWAEHMVKHKVVSRQLQGEQGKTLVHFVQYVPLGTWNKVNAVYCHPTFAGYEEDAVSKRQLRWHEELAFAKEFINRKTDIKVLSKW